MITNYDALGQMLDPKWLNAPYNPKVIRSKWKLTKGADFWYCSNCGNRPNELTGCTPSASFMTRFFKYCPNCGAKMEVE